MTNSWIEHVKKYAKDNNISYACALSMPEVKKTYVRPSIIQGETLSSAKTKYRGALKKWEIEFIPKITTFQRQSESGNKQALEKLERTKEIGRKHLAKVQKLEGILKLFEEEAKKKKTLVENKKKTAKKSATKETATKPTKKRTSKIPNRSINEMITGPIDETFTDDKPLNRIMLANFNRTGKWN